MLSPILPRSFLVWALVLAFGASAQNVPQAGDDPLFAEQGLFDAYVAIRDHSEAERANAARQGLVLVLSKLSGRGVSPTRPGLAQAFDQMPTYAQGFDYQRLEQPFYQNNEVVIVHYHPDQITALATALGLPIWPEPRPSALLWLVINDGSGPRLVSDQQAKAVQRLLNQAATRGFQLRLPSSMAVAHAAIKQAIWNNPADSAAAVMNQQAATVNVTAKLWRSHQGGWMAQWSLIDHGQVQASGTTTDSDPRRAMARIADGVAETFASYQGRQDSPVAAEGAHAITMHIVTLSSGGDYLRIAAHLEAQPSVKRIAPIRAHNQELTLALDVFGDAAHFEHVLGESAGPLEPAAPATMSATATDAPLEYRVK